MPTDIYQRSLAHRSDINVGKSGSFRRAELANLEVHILEPELTLCESLGVLFKLEGYAVDFSHSAEQFFNKIPRRLPDIVVSSLDLSDHDGLNIVRHVRALKKGVVIVMLAHATDVSAAVAAMKLGADDVVSKPIDTERLLSAVRQALMKTVQSSTDSGGNRTFQFRGFSHLTPREHEVLNLIVNGYSNKDAARILGNSPRTVEVHRARIMDKFGARNIADLIRIILSI